MHLLVVTQESGLVYLKTELHRDARSKRRGLCMWTSIARRMRYKWLLLSNPARQKRIPNRSPRP